MTAPDLPEVPEGYVPVQSSQPFGALVGPIFELPDADQVHRGFRVLERHCNRGGMAHGGMMMTVIDVILGTAVWRHTGRPALTVSMAVDFLAPARRGDWVEGTGRVVRETKSLTFVEGELSVASRKVLTASGVFKTLAPRAP
jgi:uncharacterized protein (TIGR00369 family)